MKLPLACMALLLAAGCTTPPTTEGQTTPAKMVLAPAMTTPDPTAGILVVQRDTGAYGMGCGHRVLLDGKPIAELDPGERITVYAKPGEHVVSVRTPGAICPDSVSEISTVLEVGRKTYLRTGINFGTGVRISPAAL